MGLHVDSEIMPRLGRTYRFRSYNDGGDDDDVDDDVDDDRCDAGHPVSVVSSHCCLLMRRMVERAMAP